jgi:hypothetical protein
LLVAERAQEDGIDDTEDSCGSADSESQAEDRRGGKAKVFQEHADCVQYVGLDGLHREPLSTF